jgi:FkbM family methyltransferase
VNRWAPNEQIDLVDFEGLKLFMFKHDSLYDSAIAKERKDQSLAQYQQFTRQHGYPHSPVGPGNVGELSQARFGLYLFMHHLWEHRVDFTVLDIGSHIGEFSLKMGNCVRTFAQNNRVIAFEPTEIGELMRYSIELNGLGDIVKHEGVAVSGFDGLTLFTYTPGFSDGAHIQQEDSPEKGGFARLSYFWRKSMRGKSLKSKVECVSKILRSKLRQLRPSGRRISSNTLIVRSVDILSYLERQHCDQNLFVKIDIEGLDSIVISRLLELLPTRLVSIVFEFAPTGVPGGPKQAEAYLEGLCQFFYVFDLFYVSNPTRFKLITPTEVRGFVVEVARREPGYTDVFLLDKRTPECGRLVHRLSSLEAEPDRMVL